MCATPPSRRRRSSPSSDFSPLDRRLDYARHGDGDLFLDAVQNARLVANPERYYRVGAQLPYIPLRASSNTASREELLPDQLERAIGVIYRLATEIASHYFRASLPEQFDEYIWFDETSGVTELAGPAEAGLPDTYPFGL